jgi:hypothetical protein
VLVGAYRRHQSLGGCNAADAQVAVHGGAADSDYFSDVRWCEPLGLQILGSPDLGVLSGDFLPAGLPPVFGSRSHAGPGPLGQLIALELRKSGHDSEHGPAHRPGGTDAFGNAAKVHTPLLQVIDQSQQITGIAPQPVQLPHYDPITTSQVIKEFVELGPTGPRSAHPVVGEDFAAPGSSKCCMLQVSVLIEGADPCVPEASL